MRNLITASHRNGHLLGERVAIVRPTITILGLLTIVSQLWLGPRSAKSIHAQDDITRVIVTDTADAPGTVDRPKLTASLELTAAELHVSVRDLPSIVVFHLSKAAAAQLGRAVSSTVCSTGSTTYYEWWIIGEPSNLVYSFMAENTLEDHFKLNVEDSERGRILRTVLSRLDMTVDAKAFRKTGK
jgi:hypothetical protein